LVDSVSNVQNITSMNKAIIFSCLLLGSAAICKAQTQSQPTPNDSDPKADVRRADQRARIQEGRQTGELTNKEATKLNKRERHIRRTERRAKADGTVTPAEQKKINREQNRTSRAIRRDKHNSKTKAPQ
jgi:hypothetical protein